MIVIDILRCSEYREIWNREYTLSTKNTYTTLATLSTMTTKSIRISEETYKKLVELAGKLQAELKRPISIRRCDKILDEEEVK